MKVLTLSDEIRLPRPEQGTAPGVQHHSCEHPGCGKNAGWGFAKPRQPSHWFCFEHRADGERFL
ncbi:MAG: hypothetical protein EOS70_28225 [Mesorhizobium sp.]|nr:MAG: hypothetical protein EOS70_28225 [Mesorhizobium sp.]